MSETTAVQESTFSIQDFLAEESQKDLLRFSTAGSVDDGKSTLIGRLLYDTQSVYEDQVKSIEGKGTTQPGQIDFALLTDGLRAEREQGITIDVAYRYFATDKRKLIIADTPGHEQYTRNMATGASTADATVVLIDASKGVLIQSRRHAFIASLLRVRHVLVAVNKMDLIGYDEAKFRAIESDFRALLSQIAADTGSPVTPHFIPVSALLGDNIVHRSSAMSWYDGPSLLELLESVPAAINSDKEPFRFPVQRVLRPDSTFRGFAGQIASGIVRPGDTIVALPSGRSAQVARIVTYDGDLAEAQAPLSVTLVLKTEVDISRGDLIASAEDAGTIARGCKAHLVWMDQQPLQLHRRYLLKHTSQTVPAYVTALDYRTEIGTLEHKRAHTLEINGIGVVSIQLPRPIVLDKYSENRATGAFILIDPATNSTVAAGMVREVVGRDSLVGTSSAAASGPVTGEERRRRWGHSGGELHLTGSVELIDSVERALFAMGAVTVRVPALADAVRISQLAAAGLLALVVAPSNEEFLKARVGEAEIIVETEDATAVTAVLELLEENGLLAAHNEEGSEYSI